MGRQQSTGTESRRAPTATGLYPAVTILASARRGRRQPIAAIPQSNMPLGVAWAAGEGRSKKDNKSAKNESLAKEQATLMLESIKAHTGCSSASLLYLGTALLYRNQVHIPNHIDLPIVWQYLG